MIDTDKYKRHRKTAWRCVGQPYTELAEAMAAINRNGPNPCTPADLELWADAPLLLAEVKRLRRVLEDIESMIPDNHEEVSPILSDILSECHRVLPMFNEVIE